MPDEQSNGRHLFRGSIESTDRIERALNTQPQPQSDKAIDMYVRWYAYRIDFDIALTEYALGMSLLYCDA